MTRRQRRARGKRERQRRIALGGGFVLAATLVSGSAAHADEFTVTNLHSYGAGSLLDAVYSADSNPGADSIVFSSGLSGTINTYAYVPEGPVYNGLYIFDDVTITGPGASHVTVDADGKGRPIQIGRGANVHISGLTLTGGNAGNYFGGAISTDGPLTLDGVLILDNQALAGGGIYSSAGAQVEVEHSTIYQNTAKYSGGGILAYGSTYIEDSTIAGNRSLNGAGGGIGSQGNALTLTGTTVAGNQAAAYSGGVSDQSGSITLDNSIVAGNTTNGASSDIDGGTVSAAFSLIQAPGLTTITATVANSNITGEDPKLGALADNGGQTPTMKPAPRSPVVDKGSSFAEMDDQRGLTRPFDQPAITNSTAAGADGSDMGAVELQDGDEAPNPTTFNVTNTNDTGDGSLRHAILDADANPGDDTILFDSDLTGTITLGSDLPIITEGVTITGPGSTKVTVDGDNAYQIFNITDGSQATITGLTLSEGHADTDGGAILASVPLAVDDVRAYDNHGRAGGAIDAIDGLQLTNSVISSNHAASGGGGIDAGGDVTITDTTVASNAASGDGGGIRHGNGKLTLDHSTVDYNNGSTGGGIEELAGGVSLHVLDSTVASNYATGAGGGIHSHRPLTATGSTIDGNSAHGYYTGHGGGIYMDGAAATLRDTIVAGDYAYLSGPDLYAAHGGSFSAAFSLIQSTDGATVTDEVADSNIRGVDPDLGPLQDNGGPTLTMKPDLNSPVIDKGGAEEGLTDDQRRKPRPVDLPHYDNSEATGADGSDIGAVELQTTEVPNPTTFHVTNTGDHGPGSLRQAMLDAESNSGDDTILFDSDLTGTINLASPLPELYESATITGPGSGQVAVDAGGNSRIFTLADGGGAISRSDFTITGLTLEHGSAGTGGAINGTSASLHLDDVVASHNEATDGSGGAIYARQSLTVDHSTISDNNAADVYGSGGGIWAYSGATIDHSRITGNHSAGTGGGVGVYNYGVLQLDNSTVDGNDAPDAGGIYARRAAATIVNSTIASNHGGGVEMAYGSLSGVTVAENDSGAGVNVTGGELGEGEALVIRTSIVAGNTNGGNPEDVLAQNNTIRADFSLIEAPQETNVVETVAGSDIFGEDPQLGPLQDNGGPTPTMAPGADSPVVDQGKAYDLTDDQRGDQRPLDSPSIPNSAAGGADGSDMGAVELTAPATGPVVSGIAPASGPVATEVVISGSHFTGATKVLFGGTSAAFKVDSDSQITAKAPAGTGSVDVRVVNPGTSSPTSANDKFTYTAPPSDNGDDSGQQQQQQQQQQTPPPAPPTPPSDTKPGKLSIGTSGGATLRRRRSGYVLFPGISVSCPSGASDCTATAVGTVDVGAAKRKTWVKATLTVAHGAVQAITFKLSPAAKRLLDKQRKLRVTVTIQAKAADGQIVSATKTLTVHAPKRKARS